MKTYKARIMKVLPSAVAEKGTIMTAHLQIEVNNYSFWAFTAHGWPIGDELLGFEGKIIPLRFVFLNLKTELSEEKVKKIIPLPERKKPCDYILIGEVTNKEPFHREPEKFEYLQVDCGFIVNNLSVEKDKYKIGDYIQAEGRLDAYKVDEKEGYE